MPQSALTKICYTLKGKDNKDATFYSNTTIMQHFTFSTKEQQQGTKGTQKEQQKEQKGQNTPCPRVPAPVEKMLLNWELKLLIGC